MITINDVRSQGSAILTSREGFEWFIGYASAIDCTNVEDVVCELATDCYHRMCTCGAFDCHSDWEIIVHDYDILPF